MKKLLSLILATINLFFMLLNIWIWADRKTPNTFSPTSSKTSKTNGFVDYLDLVIDVAIQMLPIVPYALATFFLFRIGINITNKKWWKLVFSSNALILVIFLTGVLLSVFRIIPTGIASLTIPLAFISSLNCLLILNLVSSVSAVSNNLPKLKN